jgi:hypothetical protein
VENPSDVITIILTSLGYGNLVPLILSIVGLFSAVAIIYPPSWRGAEFIHTMALLRGNATPLVPAGEPVQVAVPSVAALEAALATAEATVVSKPSK